MPNRRRALILLGRRGWGPSVIPLTAKARPARHVCDAGIARFKLKKQQQSSSLPPPKAACASKKKMRSQIA